MVEPSKSQMAHFEAIPWVAEELSEPDLIIREPASRVFDPDLRAFEFWSSTLHSSTTIPFFVGAYHLPPESDMQALNAEDADDRIIGPQIVTRARFFLSLGRGVSTINKNLCHGGVVAAIFDECAGAICWANKAHGFLEFLPQVTQSLNISYLKPVPTMSTIAVTALLETKDGIKLVVDLMLQDKTGTVLAKAEAVFRSIKKRKKGGNEKL
ncbi:thioesterase superfamily protein [Colletotrichum graminicola]|uniref:Thioesterase superfamily protein n=1 Tax=Colletotrichum graminicola (strain M1.001 / M2 / FGSC 10212) TaxID=645133 RepID=E3QN43_COLGM|nr:thioesterase superfamily protein [Colletotrichum graminicola M1.001]EFQ32281.1 thioesterase superfamily protein [Colletotrichum graminicola M1.001]WDK19855.1 thioesterase superfamily protein [Colletotrichum graminicola]